MWFCVSVFSAAEHDPTPVLADQIWEEHLFLIAANSEDEAKNRAEVLGRDQECSYRAVDGSTVTWKLKTVSKVYQLEGEPRDGTEVFSRFLKDSQVRGMQEPIE